MKKIKRSTLFHVNQSQRLFFYPVIIAFFLGCTVAWLSLFYFIIGQFIFDADFYQLKRAIPGFLVLAMALMITVIFWTLHISNKYFGSYERIIEDCDKIISGKGRGPLEVRKDDAVFGELVKRINNLIEKK